MRKIMMFAGASVLAAGAAHGAEPPRGDGNGTPRTAGLLAGGAQRVRIVCFGDSITGKYYHTGGRRAWPEMLALALRRAYPKADLEVVNAGRSGNTTGAGLKRIEKHVLKRKPHLVVVMFGMNDLAYGPASEAKEAVRGEGFCKNLLSIVAQCRGVGAEVILCTPNSVYPDAVPRRPPARLAVYAGLVRRVADQAGAPLADCHAAWEELRRRDMRSWRVAMSETIHPSLDGHKLIAELVAEKIAGRRISLSDVKPGQPSIPRTLARLKAGQSVTVIAGEPFAQIVPRVIEKHFPGAKVSVTSWPTRGKSLAELHRWSGGVRQMPKDLVVIAFPADVLSLADEEQFVRTAAWVVNLSLPFGGPAWDVAAVSPCVVSGEPDAAGKEARDLLRRVVLAHDVDWLERPADAAATPEQVFAAWFEGQLAAAAGAAE